MSLFIGIDYPILQGVKLEQEQFSVLHIYYSVRLKSSPRNQTDKNFTDGIKSLIRCF